MKTVAEVLADFREAIECTGGLVRLPDGCVAPAADPEWVDLATTYLDACAVAGVEPMYQDEAGDPTGPQDDDEMRES